ncbi:Oidioi.mRNA.OKI2018_I69.chr2.g4391.t1.cds [Oikopleura dioica]|uniref:Oidioi.mRNA.OKI2018_I69.chr2.g4391.t1.cds n=1 Tax=Oikopleura dioica TaxID=34765 RepID=A0ABN7SWT0_OIKDI|nr:Oidioi.mRNA.OKI2018_I69.chr2.g4391.t1.cds [Oikopleura dioica]
MNELLFNFLTLITAKHNRVEFEQYPGVLKTWDEAVECCKDKGGELAWFEDKSQFDEFLELNPTRTWLGGSDSVNEGTWLSVSRESMHLKWSSGQPDNWNGGEDCLVFNYWGNNLMNDWKCYYIAGVSCRFEPEQDPDVFISVDEIPGYETYKVCSTNEIYTRIRDEYFSKIQRLKGTLFYSDLKKSLARGCP